MTNHSNKDIEKLIIIVAIVCIVAYLIKKKTHVVLSKKHISDIDNVNTVINDDQSSVPAFNAPLQSM